MPVSVWWIPVGLALVGFTLVDQLRTTIGVGSGPGPLTRLLTLGLWRLATRRPVYGSWPLRALGGPGVLVVVVTAGAWLLTLWLGWSLVLHGSDHAVVSSSTHTPATSWQRFYFAGYTIVTVGNGSYRPLGAGSELAADAAGLSGMLLITLTLSYLISVVSAVVNKRSFAAQVSSLGGDAVAAARNLQLDDPAAAALGTVGLVGPLASSLSTVAEQHRAYPLLHAFRSRHASQATAPAVALLLDTVLVLSAVSRPSARPPRALLQSVVSAAEQYAAQAPTRGAPERQPPPLRVPDDLRGTVDQAVLERQAAEFSGLRQALAARVGSDGFSWPGAD